MIKKPKVGRPQLPESERRQVLSVSLPPALARAVRTLAFDRKWSISRAVALLLREVRDVEWIKLLGESAKAREAMRAMRSARAKASILAIDIRMRRKAPIMPDLDDDDTDVEI